jgi:hypothetical protein
MALAAALVGEDRREWALAMRVEFEAARAEGEGLAFATGCLIAAWGEMPKHAEGRLVLANYALALGLLIPMGVLQFTLALGFPSVFIGGGGVNPMLPSAASQNPLVAWSQLSSVPCLLALWLLLGISHLRLAWVLVDGDWESVAKASALIGATITTLFIVMGVLQFDLTLVILQAAAMAIELTALVAVARGHALLLPSAAPGAPAR